MDGEKVAVKEATGETTENLGNLATALKPTESFVYMDEVKKILGVALKSEKNVILYGPGGYGKSEFTVEFLKENGIIDPYIITMGTGMTTDRLFGGLDIPCFNKSGKIEYLVENSFMNSEFVVFEELFDAPDFILEQLKDILSSGVFRNGGQVFPIKTRLIICCTNKTREEFSKNNSLKALMERFPLEQKVVWRDHTRVTYENLLRAKMGHSDPMLTYVLEDYAKAGHTISPRIAITAAQIIAENGPDAISCVADFNAKPDLLKTSLNKFKSILEVTKLVESMSKVEVEIKACNITTLEGVKHATKLNKTLSNQLIKLKGIKSDESMVTMTTDAMKRFTQIHDMTKKQLDIVMAMDDTVNTELPT
jgi:MoxR-like ATPase